MLLVVAALMLIVGAAVAFELISGDGQSAGGEKAAGGTSQTKATDTGTSLIGPSDLRSVRRGSAERALLDYWASLQFQDWPGAVLAYDPALRDAIGASRLSEALKSKAAYYRTVKPKLESGVAGDGSRSVRFLLRDSAGKVAPQSVSWRREGRTWVIRFDSLLDDTLQSYAQRRAQVRINPDARAPSRRALRAGQDAAELQSNFLQRSSPRPAPAQPVP